MCIVLLTTAHPKYALVVVDNRDEFILRPTSRPHWWSPTPDPAQTPETPETPEIKILSSRDLQRDERGTWLGITKGGNFAVLTNYRELDMHNGAHPVHGIKSRGGIVTAWLGADPNMSTADFVTKLTDSGDVKGVGGFSLICGKLRRKSGEKKLEPLAIISNRYDHASEVPWICAERDEVYGLSNTFYADTNAKVPLWPKVEEGMEALNSTVRKAAESEIGQEELMEGLFHVLDSDKFPARPGMTFEECLVELKHSVFVPAMGDEHQQKDMEEAQNRRPEDAAPARPEDQAMGFMKGLYGTQRQTVLLVDWDGNVTYKERALWDEVGKPMPRGKGDMTFSFKIEGWEPESQSSRL